MTYQSLPRVFIQKPQCNIERRATPALNTIRIRQCITSFLCNIDHINRSKSRSKKRLMSISPCSIHDQSSGVFTNGFGEGFKSLLYDDVSPSNLARESCIERRSIRVLAVLEFWNDDFCFQTRLTLV